MKKILLVPIGSVGENELSRMLELEFSDRGIDIANDESDSVGISVFVASVADGDICDRVKAVSEKYPTVLICRECEGDIPETTLLVERPFDAEKLCDRLSRFLSKGSDSRPSSDATLEIKGGSAFFRGEKLSLSKTELALLTVLYENKGAPISREDLRKTVWGNCDASNVVDVYISYLRKKIDLKYGSNHIVTVRNKGYMLK